MHIQSMISKCLKVRLSGKIKLKSTCSSLFIMTILLFSQIVMASQVTLLAPRNDTRVDFERMGLRVSTYTQDQIENMDRHAAIVLGQTIDASMLVLTGARISDKALAKLFDADEVRVALDDLFRRGGMLFVGQLSAASMNTFSPPMQEYFNSKGLYLPKGRDRPNTQKTIGHFKAYANSDLLNLPILSKPHSLAKGKWAGVANNIFYWSNFPDTALPILVGPDNKYPVMLLQKDILGQGTFILSQARELTRKARSEFWENVMVQLKLSGDAKAEVKPVPQSDAGANITTDDKQVASAKPLFFLETFDGADAKAIDSSNAFTDSRIWEQFQSVPAYC